MMKEEAKRQQENGTPPATTTTTTSATNIPFNEAGDSGSGLKPTPTTAQSNQDDKDVALPSQTATPAVQFLFDSSNAFAGETTYLLETGDGEITIPLKLHAGLVGNSAFRVDQSICGFVTRETQPTCRQIFPENRRPETLPEDANGFVMFDLPEGSGYYFLRAKWLRPEIDLNVAGWSYSSIFTKAIADGNVEGEVSAFLNEWQQDVTFADPDTNSQVTIGADKTDELPNEVLAQAMDQAASASPTTSRPAATNSARVSSLPSSAAGETDATDATPTDAPSSGGLSEDAIIGIGVAAGIIGLLAIGLLVWFFCLRNRRRHRTKDHGPYAAPDHLASEYMVNKETTGAHVTESPHSPYSDDGSLAHPQGQGSSLAQVQQQQQANQYSDAPPIAAPVPRSAAQQAGDRPGSGSGTRSGTPGGGHNVSHLIEEGMTEADIRRLEEEERALDDAIERAGHGRR